MTCSEVWAGRVIGTRTRGGGKLVRVDVKEMEMAGFESGDVVQP